MRRIKNIIYYAVLLGFLLVCAASCHTVEGMGKDIEKGGEAIQGAAR